MQLFAVAQSVARLTEDGLARAIADAGQLFALDSSHLISASSPGGRVRVASIHHPDRVAEPRRYRAVKDSVHVLYDGLPVEQNGLFDAHDAHELLRRWDQLPECLEGQFCAVRIDLVGEVVEILLDTLGMVRVFVARSNGGWVASNSVRVVRSLTGLDTPDEIAVCSAVALGWPAERRTLIDGISALMGGSLHRLTPAGMQSVPRFTPPVVARLVGTGDHNGDDVARALVKLTTAAVHGLRPVQCAITGGRDSRVNLALALASGADVSFYTIGSPGLADVDIAMDLARRFNLPYQLLDPHPDDEVEWTDAAALFIHRCDGLVDFAQIGDVVDQLLPVDRLGLKFWGVGGEIGRGGAGDLVALAATVPGLRKLASVQARLISQKIRSFDGLVSDEAVELSTQYVARFCEERKNEGWPVESLGEAFYAFERVGGWAAIGPRKTCSTHDLFTPFMTRSYLAYALSLKPADRVLEVPHYRVLTQLDRAIRDAPFEVPWRPQRRSLAPALAAAGVSRTALRRIRSRRAHRGSAVSATPAPFYERWFDSRVELIRDICLSADESPLWLAVDRRRLEAALRAEPSARRHQLECLLRLTAVAWYLHGPKPTLSR